MSVSVSSWAGAAELLSAAAISCCSIHEFPTRAAHQPCCEVGLGWRVPAVPGLVSLLSPGLCPARSQLSVPGFGARGWGTHAGLFPATASSSRGPKPCELNRRPARRNSFPIGSARWVRRTQPKYGVGWWKCPECHWVSLELSHLSQHLRDGSAGSPLPPCTPDPVHLSRLLPPARERVVVPGYTWRKGWVGRTDTPNPH